MRVYGLTGGIASGKSAVASTFEGLGVPVVDADGVARALVEPGQPALSEIATRWPGAIVDGRLDRAALAKRVFELAEERHALEAILHPRIRSRVREQLAAIEPLGVPYALYEAALIFETGTEGELDGVILVSAEPATQLERLVARDGLTVAEAEARLAAQLPLEAKRVRATYVLDNDGSLADLKAQVVALDLLLRKAL